MFLLLSSPQQPNSKNAKYHFFLFRRNEIKYTIFVIKDLKRAKCNKLTNQMSVQSIACFSRIFFVLKLNYRKTVSTKSIFLLIFNTNEMQQKLSMFLRAVSAFKKKMPQAFLKYFSLKSICSFAYETINCCRVFSYFETMTG